MRMAFRLTERLLCMLYTPTKQTGAVAEIYGEEEAAVWRGGGFDRDFPIIFSSLS